MVSFPLIYLVCIVACLPHGHGTGLRNPSILHGDGVGVDTDTFMFIGEIDRDCPDPAHAHFNHDLFFSSSKIAIGSPYRSHKTIPEDYVVLAPSKIPGANIGIYATSFIPKFTWLGEYEGEIITHEEDPDGDFDTSYSWRLDKDDSDSFYVDAVNGRTSNWLRFVNCARHITEQNTDSFFCYGKVHYITVRDITPGTELLTYYGEEFAEILGIDIKAYHDTSAKLDLINKS